MNKEYDFTDPQWGHNLTILNWDKTSRQGRATCWVTPGLEEGDIAIVKSAKGSMRLVCTNVAKTPNVSDMYIFDIKPEEESDPDQQWVAKVRRYDGGYSILDVGTKDNMQKLVDEFNTQYQTDNYYVEQYIPELHSYTRNR